MTLLPALESKRFPWFVLGVTVLLGLVTIPIGFYSDDYALRGALEGVWPDGPRAWDLYRFTYGGTQGNQAAILRGELPWWTTPDLRIHLLRPLTSLTFLFDTKVFGGASAVLWHLHSLVWYVVLVERVGALFRKVLPRATANVAMLVFALSTAHFLPYAWLAARHMLIAGVTGVFGLHALLRWERLGPWLFALALLVGLAASEAAIGVLPFGVAWLVATRGSKRAVGAALPSLLTLGIWTVAYVRLDGGAVNSGGYVDPLGSPAAYARKALVMLPVMLGNAFLGLQAELVSILPSPPFVVVGVAAVVLVALMVRASWSFVAARERRVLPWAFTAAVLALAPALGGFPGARILLLPNLGFAPILAVLLVRGFTADPAASLGKRTFRFVTTSIFVVGHVVVPPLANVAAARYHAGVARSLERVADGIDLANSPEGGVRTFVLGASDPFVTIYPPIVLLTRSPERAKDLRCFAPLVASRQAIEVSRTSENELEIYPTEGPFLRGPFESLFRASHRPMAKGDRFSQCEASILVESVKDGRPSDLHVTFDVPLEDPSLRVVVWNGERFERLRVPKIGSHVTVPWSKGPLGLF
ncbi:MAG: hypothetical protein U0169_13425 [Polyangiaceae bacterium]